MDSFERNLENAQIELNIEPQNFVPVVYKSEADGSTVKDLIPTLLIIGNWEWKKAKIYLNYLSFS